MFKRVTSSADDEKKEILNITSASLYLNLHAQKYKVFLEGVDQFRYAENPSAMKKIAERLEFKPHYFMMTRKAGDSNPFLQYSSLNTRFEILPVSTFAFEKKKIRFDIDCTFIDKEFQSTFFQFKVRGSDENLIPMWALDVREEDNVPFVNFRFRDPTNRKLKRYRLFEYAIGARHLFSVVMDFVSNNSAVVCVDGIVIYRWDGTDKFYKLYNGRGEIAFGLYATDYTEQEESIQYHKISVHETA